MIDYYETKSQPITMLMVWRAYHKVKANHGSAGIDGMDWDYLGKNLNPELYKLWNRLTSGSYFPVPVRQVAIAKKDGGVRNLGIPTLLDRIAQEVVKTHLEAIVEPLFHNSSYGYRPNRSCHDAVAAAQRNTYDYGFAIDLDIKGFFDNIDHELLLDAVNHYCKDKWVQMYVERWLKAGVLKLDGNFYPTAQGTPQGGVVSPLLANIFLHVVFDKWMDKAHPAIPFERYADDVVVHCRTERQAQFMLGAISKRMGACKLQLHTDKTHIVNIRETAEKKYPRGYDFLGFTIRPNWVVFKTGSRVVPSTFVSTKSKKNISEKFKALEIHKRRKPLAEIAQVLNPIIRGLINYFHKFGNEPMSHVWNQLNHRLLKWVKWQKGLYKKAAVKWLKQQYKATPNLFDHWKLVHP
jgi:group II intron reverse transcriptase/maturase